MGTMVTTFEPETIYINRGSSVSQPTDDVRLDMTLELACDNNGDPFRWYYTVEYAPGYQMDDYFYESSGFDTVEAAIEDYLRLVKSLGIRYANS